MFVQMMVLFTPTSTGMRLGENPELVMDTLVTPESAWAVRRTGRATSSVDAATMESRTILSGERLFIKT